ncbi:MAG: PAS domain-containing protein, partial [Candidatus Hydrogenedentes bacterium]|nr:PAS domain-containing protein [Candidatus Hydrogenedentota bacterium]
MHSFPWRILLLILLVAILIASAGTWFYQEQAHYMLRRTQRDLEAIANLKVEEIEQWRGRRLADADLLVDSPIFIQTVKDWMESPSASLPEGPATRLRNFQKYYHYRDALLVRTDGQIRWSLEGRTGALTSAEQDALEQSVRRREPVLTEISFAESGTEHMAVVAPFFLPDRDMGAPVGAALLDIDPQTFLFPYLASWPTPSRSAETILVRQEGDAALIISQARHLPETPQRFRYPLTQIDSPVVQAVLGTRGVVEGRDYRGVEVLAVLSAVPNSVWFVVTKMDKAEALEAWRFRSVTIILIMLGCFTTASGALLVAWQRHEKVHYRNLFQAEAARRESEERLRYALAASETGVWEINLDDLTAQVTEVTDHIVGYTGPVSAERNVGTFLARIVPEDRPAAEREIQRAIREKNDTGLECRIIREDGARRWIRARGRIRDMGPGKGR